MAQHQLGQDLITHLSDVRSPERNAIAMLGTDAIRVQDLLEDEGDDFHATGGGVRAVWPVVEP